FAIGARRHLADPQFETGRTGCGLGRHGDFRNENHSGGSKRMRFVQFGARVALGVRPALRVCAAAAVMAGLATASGTTTWEMNSYADFIRGRFQGISLSRDGRLTLAPRMDTVFSSDEPIVWSVVRGKGGVIFAATGNRGRIYQIDSAGHSSLLWTAEQPEV